MYPHPKDTRTRLGAFCVLLPAFSPPAPRVLAHGFSSLISFLSGFSPSTSPLSCTSFPLSLLLPLSPPVTERAFSFILVIFCSGLWEMRHGSSSTKPSRTVVMMCGCSFCGQAHAQRDFVTRTQPHSLLPHAIECRQCCSIQKSLHFQSH